MEIPGGRGREYCEAPCPGRGDQTGKYPLWRGMDISWNHTLRFVCVITTSRSTVSKMYSLTTGLGWLAYSHRIFSYDRSYHHAFIYM